MEGTWGLASGRTAESAGPSDAVAAAKCSSMLGRDYVIVMAINRKAKCMKNSRNNHTAESACWQQAMHGENCCFPLFTDALLTASHLSPTDITMSLPMRTL